MPPLRRAKPRVEAPMTDAAYADSPFVDVYDRM
jgi:hypothetical protein